MPTSGVEKIDFEAWSFGTAETAAIVGVPTAVMANWVKRYIPLHGGTFSIGHRRHFGMSAIMKLAFVRALTQATIDVSVACEALETAGSPWGVMRSRSPLDDRFSPGTIVLSAVENGKLAAFWSPRTKVAIAISTWELFDDLWPRFRAAVLIEPRGYEPGRLEAALDAFKQGIEQNRAVLFGRAKTTGEERD